MFSAYNSTFDDIVNANSASKNESYYCWVCKKPLILKKGRIIRPHFAHQPQETCDDGWSHPSKTKWHRQMQALFDTTEVLMEDKRTGERHIADAVCGDIVFEFQHSSISAEEVRNRTAFYLWQGYRVVWVVDLSKPIKDGRIMLIDSGECIYNWSHASKMFSFLPLFQRKDIKVLLYWEITEVVDPQKRPLTYREVGYLNHVAWCYQESADIEVWDEEEEAYVTEATVKPDMRIFAISKRQPVDSGEALTKGLFDSIYVDKARCQRVADNFFEEREERAWQYRY